MTLPSRDAVLRYTVRELKDLAAELNINIASLTRRDDILKAVLIAAYPDWEPLPVLPDTDLVSPPPTSTEDVVDVGLATPRLPLQTSDFSLPTSALPFHPFSLPVHTIPAATSYPTCVPATYLQNQECRLWLCT
jgi:hypothetical protein